MAEGPPDAVSHDGVTVRRWQAADAPALHDAILTDLEHLRPWMAWIAREPLDIEERRAKVAEWIRTWDAAEDFGHAIVDASGVLLGACGLHPRIGTGGLEIGYWVRADHTGRGVATRAVRALVESASSVDGITHVEIHHDLANVASARVPVKAGFTRIGERQDDKVAPAEVGVDVTWRHQLPPTDGAPVSYPGTDSVRRHRAAPGS